MKIIYNPETRTFGIHSDRVRDYKLKYYKDNYGVNSSEYNDYKDRVDLIDFIESIDEDKFTPYGYAASPKRVTDLTLKKYKDDLPKGYYRSRKGSNPVSRDRMKGYNNITELIKRLKHQDMSYKSLYGQYNDDVNAVNKEYINNVDISRYVSPKVESQADKEGVAVLNLPLASMSNEFNGVDFMNISKDSDDSDASHELEHIRNKRRGILDRSKYKKSHDRLSNPRTSIDYNSNDVNNYISDVLQEEDSANRGRVMNSYLYGGDLTDKELENIQKVSDLSQDTYKSRIGGYNPPSLRYNMDKDAYINMKSNINKGKN